MVGDFKVTANAFGRTGPHRGHKVHLAPVHRVNASSNTPFSPANIVSGRVLSVHRLCDWRSEHFETLNFELRILNSKFEMAFY